MGDTSPTLQHIAFIMDGNGRWAKARGLPRLEGHRRGVESVRMVCTEAMKAGVPYVSFYAFSTENWQRPKTEVQGLFSLMEQYFKRELKKLLEQGIRVRFVGDHSPTSCLSPSILQLMADVEEQSKEGQALTAIFAINYSGQQDILSAVEKIRQKAKKGQAEEPITKEQFAQHLGLPDVPDPDILVRTSGEQRISNFMLWQLAYTELFFTPYAWPDFTPENFQEILQTFEKRERRFGALVE